MKIRRLILALALLGILRAAQAAESDVWFDALATTRVQILEAWVGEGATLEKSISATLTAVRAQHPELRALRVVASPATLALEHPVPQRAPAGPITAGQTLLALVARGVRLELADDRLLLLRVGEDAEFLWYMVPYERDRAASLEAIAAGKADADLLDRAGLDLRQAHVVSSSGIGYAGTTDRSLLAFMVVLQAPDAAERFAAILREATPEGKFLARAGLWEKKRLTKELADPLLFDGPINLMSGCIGSSENSRAFFDREVVRGNFVSDIRSTVQHDVDRRGEFAKRFADLVVQETKHVGGPAPVGRVLNFDFSRPSATDWDFGPK